MTKYIVKIYFAIFVSQAFSEDTLLKKHSILAIILSLHLFFFMPDLVYTTCVSKISSFDG